MRPIKSPKCTLSEAHADAAFKWLDRAFSQRDGGLTEIKGVR
jgi:hypothetical protein